LDSFDFFREERKKERMKMKRMKGKKWRRKERTELPKWVCQMLAGVQVQSSLAPQSNQQGYHQGHPFEQEQNKKNKKKREGGGERNEEKK